MKQLLTNQYSLKEEDMTEVVKELKSYFEIQIMKYCLLTHIITINFRGHIEEGETLIETVNREITEETGMVLNINSLEPLLVP